MTKNKLWQTAASPTLDPRVEAYTKGNDTSYDQKLLGYDIVASKAHAKMLQSIDILSADELEKLLESLDGLKERWQSGKFLIQPDQEDCHSAIEEYLVEATGDIGKKIHTGRSRNDQVLVMLRLYMKDQIAAALDNIDQAIQSLDMQIMEHGNTVMPGYTHMQKAMPTTVGTWLDSYKSAFADTKVLLCAALEVIDQNPLGSAAGFGISLNIDRDLTTRELGFKKVQSNPMYCGLSRGFFELISLQALNTAMIMCGKFANDMLLFTTQEFGFFSLPDSFVTGSSIMPQKKNYDVLEIMRGNVNGFQGHIAQIQSVYTSIGSGFQRDLQLTKAIFVDACETTQGTLQMLSIIINNIHVHDQRLASAITDDMKSVEKINRLVEQGVPFRDAYKQIKSKMN